MGLIPGQEDSPGEGNGNPLQYCCLKNPMDRGAWGTAVHGVEKELDMTEHARTHRTGEVGKLEMVRPIYSAQKSSRVWVDRIATTSPLGPKFHSLDHTCICSIFIEHLLCARC